jgi:uncharacterized protein YcbK (DUF882 family)
MIIGIKRGLLLTSLAAFLLARPALSATHSSDGSSSDGVVGSRELSFYHTHTGKRLDVVYWKNGVYLESALANINDFLSDFRTGDVVAMDPLLLDLLHRVYRDTNSHGHFEVISAYRSKKTNEMLSSKSSGVARKSQHLHGKAIDVRLTDVSIKRLRAVAFDLGIGGVGYYEKSNFVHLDTGRFRTW